MTSTGIFGTVKVKVILTTTVYEKYTATHQQRKM
jgi:hypothetical protein